MTDEMLACCQKGHMGKSLTRTLAEGSKSSSPEYRQYLDRKSKEELDRRLIIALNALRHIETIYETGVVDGSRQAMYARAHKALADIKDL